MSPGAKLAAADSAAKKKDSGKKKGGASQTCRKAAIVVTVVPKDGARVTTPLASSHKLFVQREGTPDKHIGSTGWNKPRAFGGLEPGTYEVSAKPFRGSGYAFEQPVSVTVGVGQEKTVKVELVPHEIEEVRPNEKKSHHQYVNLKAKPKKKVSDSPPTFLEGDPFCGKEFEVTAHLKKKEADVVVYWDLDLGQDNGKFGDKALKAKRYRFKITKESKTDAEGVARAKLSFGEFGGDTVRAMAALSEKVKSSAAAAKKSDEFVVWRKHWYQLSYPESANLPARQTLKASFDRVFLSSVECDERKFKKAEFAKHYRPAWQFKPNDGNADKLCVGTHNIKEFAKLYVAPTGDCEPKSHVILCDWQWDAKDCRTKWIKAEFVAGDNPVERLVKTQVGGADDDEVGVFEPSLEEHTEVLVEGEWTQYTYDAHASDWVISHKGKLKPSDYRLDPSRAASREVLVKRPTGTCGKGCPCGGRNPAAPKVDQDNDLVAWVRFSAAQGTYLGWAEAPFHTVVILEMSEDDLNDVVNHEIGHLFGQTPPQLKTAGGIPPHPKMYQQRGGSGTHCAEGAAWRPKAGGKQLNPKKKWELDAQGNASGKYKGGTCIMFGIGNAGKREFCEHCAAQLNARNLSRFVKG